MDIEKIKQQMTLLEKEYNRLDFLIQEEYNRYQDDRSLLSLKNEKLAIKQELEKLKKRIEDHGC